ncbi:MAG: hypothetical protein LIP09_15385 [Bacteroidales bacterium]|nr:hypothetical protein [Bacteroidales bacterium]
MADQFSIEDYYPSREKIEADIESLNLDWVSALLEWDDILNCQLEDGEVSKNEVENKAQFYKTAFIEGILQGSRLTGDEK